jgi:hypothetical protein
LDREVQGLGVSFVTFNNAFAYFFFFTSRPFSSLIQLPAICVQSTRTGGIGMQSSDAIEHQVRSWWLNMRGPILLRKSVVTPDKSVSYGMLGNREEAAGMAGLHHRYARI